MPRRRRHAPPGEASWTGTTKWEGGSPMRRDDDDILALGAAWLAGYVVSCWHSEIVLGDIILHADGSIETKAPEVWQLLDAPVVVDCFGTAPAAGPLLAQPLRPEDDIH